MERVGAPKKAVQFVQNGDVTDTDALLNVSTSTADAEAFNALFALAREGLLAQVPVPWDTVIVFREMKLTH